MPVQELSGTKMNRSGCQRLVGQPLIFDINTGFLSMDEEEHTKKCFSEMKLQKHIYRNQRERFINLF